MLRAVSSCLTPSIPNHHVSTYTATCTSTTAVTLDVPVLRVSQRPVPPAQTCGAASGTRSGGSSTGGGVLGVGSVGGAAELEVYICALSKCAGLVAQAMIYIINTTAVPLSCPAHVQRAEVVEGGALA